jgi:hypothetical protein
MYDTMEKTALIELNDTQMLDTSGGGFAYDVGRFLRYLALGGGTSLPYYAMVDWAVNDAVNEIVNNPPE